MTEERMANLEADLRSVTDQIGRLMDQINQKGFVMAFRCGHSGLLLPSDYIRNWGRPYGVGLGPDPVSEVLDTEYEISPPPITPDIRRIEQIMFPVRNTRVQMDMVMVSPVEFSEKAAIVAADDPDMDRRSAIVRQRQLANPNGGALVSLYTEWNRIRKGGL